MALSKGYDFSWYQMYCDDALARLGLARRISDENYEYVDCPRSEEFLHFDEVAVFAPTLRERTFSAQPLSCIPMEVFLHGSSDEGGEVDLDDLESIARVLRKER